MNIFLFLLGIHFILSFIYAILAYTFLYRDWPYFVVNMLFGSYSLIMFVFGLFKDRTWESIH
jgi:hypothetical protein